MTKLYKRDCHKCDGTGILPHYVRVFGGTCFACGGLGYRAVKTDPAILDARNAKAAEKREAKREAERQAYIKRNFWKKLAIGIRQAVLAAERQAEHQAAEAIVNGKQTITGVVVSTKFVEGYYGGVTKMLIKDDKGFKVWGSVPAALYDAMNDEGEYLDALKGRRVTFTATVEASNDDDKFGFFKRPTKAAIAA